MAVVWCRQVHRGSSFSGSWDEENRGERKTYKFLVRVDTLNEPEGDILSATKITYGKKHDKAPHLYAADVDISCEDQNGLLWSVTWVYRDMKDKTIVDPATGLPKTEWQASGSSHTVGLSRHYVKKAAVAAPELKPCVNAAGQPMEGLKRNIGSIKWRITKGYKTTLEWRTAADAIADSINNKVYGNIDPHKWYCTFGGAEKKKFKKLTITNPGDPSNEQAGAKGTITEEWYWSVTWEIESSRDTWNHMVYEQGFMEKADANGNPSATGTKLATIKGADGKPVKEPVMLNASGLRLPSTEDPVVVNGGKGFQAYPEADFELHLGPYPT